MEEFDLSTCIDIEEEKEIEQKNIDQEWKCDCGGVYELDYDVMCCKKCANVTTINKNNNNSIINKNETLDMSNNKLSVKKVYGKNTSIVIYPSYNKNSKMTNIKNDFRDLQVFANKIDMKIITFATDLYDKLVISNDLVKKKDKKKEIQIGCIYISYIHYNEPRTKSELASHFNLAEISISAGLKNIVSISNTFKLDVPVYNNKSLIPLFVNRYLKILNIEADLTKLSNFVANNKMLNGSANPENVAGGIVFFFAEIHKLNFNMNEFMENTKLTKKSINDSKKRIIIHYVNIKSPYHILKEYSNFK